MKQFVVLAGILAIYPAVMLVLAGMVKTGLILPVAVIALIAGVRGAAKRGY